MCRFVSFILFSFGCLFRLCLGFCLSVIIVIVCLLAEFVYLFVCTTSVQSMIPYRQWRDDPNSFSQGPPSSLNTVSSTALTMFDVHQFFSSRKFFFRQTKTSARATTIRCMPKVSEKSTPLLHSSQFSVLVKCYRFEALPLDAGNAGCAECIDVPFDSFSGRKSME